MLAREVGIVRDHGSEVVVFEPSPEDVTALSTDQTDEATRCAIAERARDAVVARLAADADLAAAFAGAAAAAAGRAA